MKKISTLLLVVFFAFSSSFAAGKGDKVSAKNVFAGELLNGIDFVTDNGVINLRYNDKSQLVSMKSAYMDFIINSEFDYDGGTIDNFNYDVKINITDDEEDIVMYIALNDNLFASSVYQVTESKWDGREICHWNLEYNKDGQLVKTVYIDEDGEEEATSINYSNGDILSVVESEDGEEEMITLSYPNMIENVSGIMIYDMAYGVDLDDLEMAYFAGLLGKPSKHLPERSTDSDGYDITIKWTLNEVKYPVSMEMVFNDGYVEKYVYNFTWGAGAGVESVEATQPKAVEYYNLTGAKLANPVKGVNIVRNADGTISKIFVR